MLQFPKITKPLAFIMSVLAISLSLAYFVSAWTEPTVNPPNSNTLPPLNIGSIGQSKVGGLILNTGGAVNGLIVQGGNVGIGTASPNSALDIAGILTMRETTASPVSPLGQSRIYIDSTTKSMMVSINGRPYASLTAIPSGYSYTNGNCPGFAVYYIDAPGTYTWSPNTGCLESGRWPTISELQCIYANKASFGNNFSIYGYWSSTASGSGYAWSVMFNDGFTSIAPKSDIIPVRCVRGITPPSQVIGLSPTIGNAQVVLNWTAPADNGFAITSYKVYRGTSSGGETLLSSGGCSGLGAVLTCTDTGLTGGTTYYYKVSAVNFGGEGSQSAEVNAIPTATTPFQVIGLSPTASNAQVVLNWITPANGGSAITNYKIYRSTPTNGSYSLLTTLGNVLTYTNTGLTNNTAYYYKVSAVNAIGEGSQSAEVSATPAATSPSQVTGLSPTAGDAQVVLNWTAPADNGSAITNYKIYRSTPTNGSYSLLTTLGNVLTYTNTGLTNGTTYYYKVSAVNAVGEGIQSAEVNAIPNPFACGNSFTITHTASDVAPVTKTVTYGTVYTNLSGANKCWITQNLGADNQASSATDATEASAGWYWQFNRKQGFKHDGTTRTPSTAWIDWIDEAINWTSANDPCTLLLGSGWRLPTYTEWFNADANGAWANRDNTYASVLKLHAAGYLYGSDGGLRARDSDGGGWYWTTARLSNTGAYNLRFSGFISQMTNYSKANGFSVRCLKD